VGLHGRQAAIRLRQVKFTDVDHSCLLASTRGEMPRPTPCI
jgi:hypothetical protein